MGFEVRLEILGTRGEIEEWAPRHRWQSGVLVDGQLLLDIGEERFLERDPRWILVTHLHPDHAYWIRRRQRAPDRLTVVKGSKRVGPYQVVAVPTIHSLKVRSQGYVVRRSGHSIFYTGDLVWIEKRYWPLVGKVDLVVTEASFVRKGGMVRKGVGGIYGHNGVPDLLRLMGHFSNKICLMHFGSWFFQDVATSKKTLTRLGRDLGLEVLVGYDGMKLRI